MTPKVLCETQKFCGAENLIFSVLKLPQCGLVIIYKQIAEISKHSSKKIMQMPRTVVTKKC